ncbi:MAG: T9SS type A sorting domain-containing protein [Bacteroidota bacterium]
MRKILPLYLPLICFLGLLVGQVHGQTFVSLNLTQPAALGADAGADGLVCPGDSALIGGATAGMGGTTPYTYLWSPNTGLNGTMSMQQMAAPGVTTDYVLTVTDAANCTAFDTVTVEIDTCVGLTPGIGIEAFDVFPNPNAGQFAVSVQGNFLHAPLQISVLNPLGQVIETRTPGTLSGKLESKFDLGRLSKGTYLVVLQAGEHRISRRIIIH